MSILSPEDFIIRFFEKINLHTKIIDWYSTLDEPLDLGLRKVLLRNDKDMSFRPLDVLPDLVSRRTICLATDRYLCHYIMIPLPKRSESLVLMAGPYLHHPMSLDEIQELSSRQNIPHQLIGILSQYYAALPCLENENLIENFLSSIGEALYEDGNFSLQYYSEKTVQTSEYYTEPVLRRSEDIAAELSRRYEIEESMMEAISRGDTERAVRYQNDPVFHNLDERTSIPLRNQKNYQIILNTLCRKAAQRGGVHPFYLDELSRRFAIQIENASTMSQIRETEREMVRRYCLLVKSHSTMGYSPVIRDIADYISTHFAETDLTLQNIAAEFSLNKNYLATLFKKETGTTLTQYVNACRIRQAIYFLNMQSGSIQDIASACGIPDTTYFTRLFRRQMNMTPSEYRKMLLKK